MNKILIVGGNSYIGYSIVKAFLTTPYNITIFDDMSKFDYAPVYANSFDSKNDQGSLEHLLNIADNYNFIIWIPHESLFKNTDYKQYEIIELLKGVHKHFILLSDSSVYGLDNMFCESDENSCTDSSSNNNYELLLLEDYVKENLTTYSILRVANLYGHTTSNLIQTDLLLNKEMKDLVNTKLLPYLVDDKPICIIHINDLGLSIVKIIEKKLCGIINIGAQNTTWNDLINQVVKFQHNDYYEEITVDSNLDENIFKHLDLDKLKTIGFKPMYKIHNFIHQLQN